MPRWLARGEVAELGTASLCHLSLIDLARMAAGGTSGMPPMSPVWDSCEFSGILFFWRCEAESGSACICHLLFSFTF